MNFSVKVGLGSTGMDGGADLGGQPVNAQNNRNEQKCSVCVSPPLPFSECKFMTCSFKLSCVVLKSGQLRTTSDLQVLLAIGFDELALALEAKAQSLFSVSVGKSLRIEFCQDLATSRQQPAEPPDWR